MIANLRKAAQKVQAEREAEQRGAARPWMGPRPPRFRGQPGEFPFAEPPAGMPPEGFAPPDFPIPLPPGGIPPVPPTGPPGAERPSGLGALTELQRKTIYGSAMHQDRMQEMAKKQMDMRKQRKFDTSHLERALAERDKQLDRLCQSHRISREELEQIIAEGKRKNW